MTTLEKIDAFRSLHEKGCFVLPNPWDAGSAHYLSTLAFSALATSSAGLGFTLARSDSPAALGLDATLRNVREIVDATDLPVNADFQAGYGATPDEVATSVTLCVETGVAGLSIEDATGDARQPLYELDVALERLGAAKRAIAASGRDVVLTARAECFLVDHPDPLAESIRRLEAYAESGADCLYAPGAHTPEQIEQIVAAVAPRPINVLVADPAWMTVRSLSDLGVRRISVGSALARAAWSGFIAASQEIVEGGFTQLAKAEPFDTLNDLFSSRD